ncbi:chromate resistance protein ChrB domain-containing protein [Thalassovita taeanensis]|uniref:Rhodanese domain-containing protein n=1 Tax=Thalassovita taeanensis TaxID=657014 RepID=A0A1H9J9V7_9RHOB|nr:sulfurtransferase/chromate resistance protein [Thalassovita taeanensis]SEQ83563.1 hypothetical protein SAMN04488092_11469 [Thalassovita taeanensis]
MPSFTEISPAQLNRLIGTPYAPILLDLRLDEDFSEAPVLIPGARRFAYDRVGDHAAEWAGETVILICHKGKKISHGAAALLRLAGSTAEVLEGGMVAWVSAGHPCVSTTALPGLGQYPTRWVTRHRPKIDRIACPWLIRRFIDPHAQFLFVPPAEVRDVADRFAAIPFDIEGGEWSHQGRACTFDTMLSRFALHSETLDALALIVRAADTNSHDLAPQAAGLLAISVGLSKLFKSDLEQMQAGFIVYDALYRWARDGRDEGHDWPAGIPT